MGKGPQTPKVKINHVPITARNKIRKLEKLLKKAKSDKAKKQYQERIEVWQAKLKST